MQVLQMTLNVSLKSALKHMFDMDEKLRETLELYPSLEITDDGKKIRCTWSGHEMPCRLTALQSYVEGKKYQRLKEKHTNSLLEKHRAHLVPSSKKGHERQLFCKLTLRHLNTLPHHIERHVNGRRFTKALARWEECQRTGAEFHARPKQKRQRHDSLDSNSSVGQRMTSMKIDGEESESDNESVDSLSDLYPAADFVEDDVEDDMDVDGGGDEAVALPVSSKRKSSDGNTFAMKRSSKNKMPKAMKHRVKKMKT